MNTRQSGVDIFPKYLIQIGSERKFLPLNEAAAAFASLYTKVSIVGEVLEDASGKTHRITQDEQNQIVHLADDIDVSK